MFEIYSHFFVRSSQEGFTLVEMMVAVAIAAILLATAAPSFQTMVIKSNVEAIQDDFANAVITARTEAAARGKLVRVCPINGCNGFDWSEGWKLEVDSTNGGLVVTEDLASFPNDIGYAVTVHSDAGVSEGAISFSPQGYNASDKRYIFAVCGPSAVTPKMVRGVTIERTGRAFYTRSNDGSEIHRATFDDGNGGEVQAAELKCTQA